MFRLWSIAVVLLSALIVGSASLAASVDSSSAIPCTSGKYSGKTAKGHKIGFTVDCDKKVVKDLSFTFNVRCLDDKHRESGHAALSANTKIKKKTYKNPENGKKENVYFLAYSKKATELVAKGVQQQGTVLLRGTTPPTGTIKGTVNLNYSYGEDPDLPEEYLYNCGGVDGGGSPAKFTVKRR